MLKPRQRGDTIVEVLIVLAVMGLALSTSYSIANRSLKDVRSAQEHSQALQLAQTQLEDLRAWAAKSHGLWSPNYCFVGANPTPQPAATCAGSVGFFTPKITNPGGGTIYDINVSWQEFGGPSIANVDLTYEVQ